MLDNITIEGLSRGEILITIADKKIRIMGELSAGPNYVFYAYINSFNKWEHPFENRLITEEEKQEIIKLVTEKSKDAKVKIIFE